MFPSPMNPTDPDAMTSDGTGPGMIISYLPKAFCASVMKLATAAEMLCLP